MKIRVKDFPLPWGQVLVWLSIPGLLFVTAWGWRALVDPNFTGVPEAEVLQELLLPPPQSLAEIKDELKRANLTLGEQFPLGIKDLALYPVLNHKKEVRQIRLYQAAARKFRGKWHLVDAVEVTGLRQSTIDAVRQRYQATTPGRGNDPIRPFTELQELQGEQPKEEIWFLTSGKANNGVYGLIFHLTMKPQPRLYMLAEWVSPGGKLPTWQEVINLPPKPNVPDRAEIVIDQTLEPEPFLEILRVVPTGDKGNPYELRNISLAERGKLGKTYSNALLLARAGLWSPALKIWQKPDEKLSIPIREQHAYIAYHANLTAQRAQQALTDVGEQVRNLFVDGQFAQALTLATRSDSNARSIINLLQKDDRLFWRRVQASLQVNNDPSAYAWGAIIVMVKEGLPSARAWLRERSRATPENLAVLDTLDVAPLTIRPQQFLATLVPLEGTPTDRWYLPPGELTVGQTWYVVTPMAIRDGKIWQNTPIAEFGQRSPKTVWKALSLDRLPLLNVIEIERPDYASFFSVTARSIWVDEAGNVEILASGSEYISRGIAGNRLPMVVVNGGSLSQLPRQRLGELGTIVSDRVGRAIYGELQTFGEVSLDLPSFQQRLQEWQVTVADINGDSIAEIVMEIQQDQVDLGNRYYPMVAVFTETGDLIYSTIREQPARKWVGVLPGNTGGQILTELDGRYEIWNF
ncbi:MAG: hypothetical protein RMK91_09360 [Pseudanabaenaceae cyanobacterium SKYGB_i_bin29]|nr:hypothetical protein [Pseudanabaenaceae cyanobacterium SKYG29]MDW8422063.1 hypothetical protein [Pseudanabaenaceae cyanobacterium SKYGB_i_bin29]